MAEHSILLMAGEASGDYHAAALIHSLKEMLPDIRVKGIAGDRCAAAGMELLHHYRDINTIGLGEGLRQLRKIWAVYQDVKKEIRSGEHDLFVPVDYPDVNLRLCLHAKRAGLPVCYYVSPQVWAWRRGRIHKIARRVDHMMTIFPFEEELYHKVGAPASFVGHTMVHDIPVGVDRASARRELGIEESLYTVALAPGSRPAEITRMLPVMCEAARIFSSSEPDVQFALPLAAAHLKSLVNDILAGHKLHVEVLSADAAQIMAASDCGLVTSGTATLQAALAGMPHAVVYIIDPYTWWLALNILKPLMMDKDLHLAIANVLAIDEQKRGSGPIVEMLQAGIEIPCLECGRPLFVPEILQDEATPEELAVWLTRFRHDDTFRLTMEKGFRQIREILSPFGGRPIAAETVRSMLEKTG